MIEYNYGVIIATYWLMKKRLRAIKYIIYRETVTEPFDHFLSFIGAFSGIGLIGFLNSLNMKSIDNIFLIGSFGASAVLIYGATNSPLAQPRNLIGGHLISALVGVVIYKILPNNPEIIWLKCALAVSLSTVFMQITKTIHPPGGATAMIANIGTEKVKSLGFYYIINPVLVGALILLVIALIINNTSNHRSYPYKTTNQ